ncbi:MAG: helix-turn-helix domain containing protein [Chloroflexi bacterium]|nr:helix-turn-helix domain containing protein [Chloroflexota bacterium]
MPQQTLGDIFRKGSPVRGPEERHAWLTAEERRFILWAFRQRWSAARIGRALGVNEATVRRFRHQYLEAPLLLLDLDLFEMVGSARNEEYKCLVCGDRVVERREVERHVVGHYVEESVIDQELPRPPRRRGRGAKKQAKRGKGRGQ